METYLLQSSILIAVFYSFYFLLLRKEPSFQLNRFYLLGGIILTFLLPLLPEIQLNNPTPALSFLLPEAGISANSPGNTNSRTLDLISPLMIIYISGVTWFSLRYLNNLFKIVFLYRRFPKTTVNGQKAVVLDGNRTPFTFFNVLFIDRQDIRGDKSVEIIEHEMAHIRQLHSIDSLAAELAVIVLWFNPFIWFVRNALKTGHEYAADKQVLKEGYNMATYQHLLVSRTMGIDAISMTSNFNYSLLKKRLLMMKNNKSKRGSTLKYTLIIPLLLAIFAFTLTDVNHVISKDDKVYDKVEVMPEFPGGFQAVRQHIATHITYPEIAKNSGVSGRIFVKFIVNEKGEVTDPEIMRSDINEYIENEVVVVAYKPSELKNAPNKEAIRALEEEALRVVKTLPDFKPGKNKGKAVKVQYTFPIQFSLN